MTGQLASKESENYTLSSKLKDSNAALDKMEEDCKSLRSQLDNVTSTLHSKVRFLEGGALESVTLGSVTLEGVTLEGVTLVGVTLEGVALEGVTL